MFEQDVHILIKIQKIVQFDSSLLLVMCLFLLFHCSYLKQYNLNIKAISAIMHIS